MVEKVARLNFVQVVREKVEAEAEQKDYAPDHDRYAEPKFI